MPILRKLFHEVSEPGQLEKLDLTEVLNWTAAALNRVFWAGTEQWDALLADRAAMSGAMVLSDFTRDAIVRFRK